MAAAGKAIILCMAHMQACQGLLIYGPLLAPTNLLDLNFGLDHPDYS